MTGKTTLNISDATKEVSFALLDALAMPTILWDENNIPLYCNQATLDLLGLSSREEFHKDIQAFAPEHQPDGTSSHGMLARMSQKIEEDGSVVFEWTSKAPDGELFPVEITLVQIVHQEKPYFISYARDLREEKRMLAEMHEADERAQVMLDATPLCCNFWDENIHNLDCNQEAVRLFGLKDKQEYLDRFNELSPEYQPDGQLSSEKAEGFVKKAFAEGHAVFEWLHQKLDGEPVPSEITLVRTKQGEKTIIAGYTRDLREEKRLLAEMREADERAQIMLDATPLCCNFWDENMNNIDCNQEAVNLFELKDEREYLERFNELSPEYQPDGQPSSEKAADFVKKAFAEGRVVFDWMHQKLNGEPIPSEITLVRAKQGDKNIVAGYTRDLREEKRLLAEMREADERAQIMLDATPLCCNLWDENMNNIDCNQEAVNLFGLKSKQEYLDRFFELSPEYQPDGQLSSEKSASLVKRAFEEERVVFEWMHQKLNGEPVPSEITLVRVKRGDNFIVAGYTRDLRELKNTVRRLDQLEGLAFTDSGTGVYNKRYFMTQAERAFASTAAHEGTLAILMMDLDKFKSINDTYGHLSGDAVLKEVAETTKGLLRPDDLLARYGGEEFVIMARNADQGIAEMLGERIRSSIANLTVTYNNVDIKVTVSVGVALRLNDEESLEETIGRADSFMYDAKQTGRNRVIVS